MSAYKGKPILWHTINRILANFDSEVILVSPEFDKNGELKDLAKEFEGRVRTHFSHDDSPLDRFVTATAKLNDEDVVLRVNGLNFFFLKEMITPMAERLAQEKLDIIKFKDDFPAQLGYELYRLGALRKVRNKIAQNNSPENAAYRIHPKFYFYRDEEFSGGYVENINVDDEQLSSYRQVYAESIADPRDNIVELYRIKSGDRLGHHYEMAKDFLNPSDHVLDIACGSGTGSKMLKEYCASVVGADLDPTVIVGAKEIHKDSNIRFTTADVTKNSV